MLLLSACLSVAWLNPTYDKIDAGNRLFKQGKYDEAIGKFGELLVDDPDSPLLNYNMGAANYKAGKYSEAIASFGRVKATDNDSKRLAKVAYNAGNAQYRLGAAAATDKPQDALNAYAAALVAYRRALGADPNDRDAKFNYELVTRKIDELKKKLEEQQQQDQQKQDEQKQDQQQGDQQQEKQPDEQEQPQAGEQDQKQDEQQQAGDEQQEQKQEQKKDEPAAQEQAGAAQPGGDKKEEMSEQEAASLVDAAKNDEVRPEDFARKLKGGVADAAEDW